MKSFITRKYQIVFAGGIEKKLILNHHSNQLSKSRDEHQLTQEFI
jgi:hypothetical protein